MNPFVSVGIILGAVLFGGVAGYRIGTDHIEAQIARESDIEQRSRDAALKVTAEAIAGIQIKNTTIRQQVERQIRENTVYRDCVIDPVMQRLLDDARAGRNPIPVGASDVPATGANLP